MEEFDLRHVFETLMDQAGHVRIGKDHGNEYPFIPIPERKRMLIELLEIAKERGVERFIFDQTETQRTIVQVCYPDHAMRKMDSTKRGIIRNAILTDLRHAMNRVYPADLTRTGPGTPVPVAKVSDASSNSDDEVIDMPTVQGKYKLVDKNVIDERYKIDVEIDDEAAEILGFKK